MKFLKYFTLTCSTFLYCGCSPLQQAPLVYSSKLIVGVDVSANASESPGASVNIGVKSVDVAYVPIAVSKTLDPNAKRTDEATVEILRIYASYGVDDSGSSSKDLTETNKTKIVAYLDAWKSQNDLQTKAQTEKLLFDQGVVKLDQLKSIQSAVQSSKQLPGATLAASAASAPDVSLQAIESINKRLIGISPDQPILAWSNGAYNFDEVLQKLDSLVKATGSYIEDQKHNTESAQQAVAAAKQLADERFIAAAQAASLVNTKKYDALSVYGRFDSNGSAAATASGTASAPTTNGSVLVGKVFSTGLASQNLTEAVMIEARSKCITSALNLAATLPDTEKTIFLAKLEKVCLSKGPNEANR